MGAVASEHAVVIVGGGPTGLTLAGELALADVDVAIVERRLDQAVPGRRAGGLYARTIEVFDQRGIADRFIDEGTVAPLGEFAGVSLNVDLPTRHNYVLALRQSHIERILAGWVAELGVPVHHGREVTGFTQDEDGVEVAFADGPPLRAGYLVGCDGGRSLVRKAAGIAFPGADPTTSNLIAEVQLAREPAAWGIRHDALGIHALSKLEDGLVGVLVTEREVGAGEPTLLDLSEALTAVYGTDYGVHSPLTISRFTDATRQAAAYRDRRVLLAGDAAHIHPPDGGQGLQTGVQDAVNLGWKLGLVVKGTAPERLLDTYHAERHPVAARVLRNSRVLVALRRRDETADALRESLAELVRMDEPRRHYAAMRSGLDLRYDLGEGHPLLGRRMPDLDLVTAVGPRRVFELLRDARPVLLNLGTPGALDAAPWADRVRLVDGEYGGAWDLPAAGVVAAPAAVLVRPDGHVAWVGDGTHDGLAEALTTWFGPPAAAQGSGPPARSTMPHHLQRD
jgi:2-polyprenyl-6-methoxyphenol hydroxylase-like FAD-dependent oxidoreductase